MEAAGPMLGGGQILACAASNVAVDNLVAGLLSLGVRVVRVGQPVKARPDCHDSLPASAVHCSHDKRRASAQLVQIA